MLKKRLLRLVRADILPTFSATRKAYRRLYKTDKEAEPLCRRGIEINQRVLGEKHPDTAASYRNVTGNLNAQGRYEEAEPLFVIALRLLKASLPENHPYIKSGSSSFTVEFRVKLNGILG